MNDSTAMPNRRDTQPRRYPVWLYMVPVGLAGGMALAFLIDPEFYHRYVLYWQNRERQIVEYITFGSALASGLILVWAAWRLWRQGTGTLMERGGIAVIVLVGLAALFFAGEEVSWGQWLFGWETPEAYREISGETNLHNADLPININSLGSLFLIVVFFVLPFIWKTRWPKPLPGTWRPAIAEAPVIFCMAFAFAWKEVKNLYEFVNPDYEDIQTYHDFFEQINEHKEMLVAVALLMYAAYRVSAVRLLNDE